MRGWKIVGKTINVDGKLIAEFAGESPNHIHISGNDEIQTNDFMKEIRIYRNLPNNDGTKYLEFFHFDAFGNCAEF